jgi:hypothetical protein
MFSHIGNLVSQDIELLAEVDFKWLMAGQGRWVDPDRLLHDPAYAKKCLQEGMDSPCAALRDCAFFLQKTLLSVG